MWELTDDRCVGRPDVANPIWLWPWLWCLWQALLPWWCWPPGRSIWRGFLRTAWWRWFRIPKSEHITLFQIKSQTKWPQNVITWTTAFNNPLDVPSDSGYVNSAANSNPTGKYPVMKKLEKEQQKKPFSKYGRM